MPKTEEKVIKTTKKAPAKVAKKQVTEVSATVKSGISVNVYGMDGKAAGKTMLPSEIFNAKINPVLMAQAIRVYLAGQRNGTASTKTRGEVSGTTKKIYRQKGTGRARHGAAKAPLFVGGGITFGPKPRDFALDLPKKMRKKALFSALTVKFTEDRVKVLDLSASTGKTKEMMKALNTLEVTKDKKGNVRKVMVVINTDSKNVGRAVRNIEGATVLNAANLNTYQVLNSNALLFVKDSIAVLEKTFLRKD